MSVQRKPRPTDLLSARDVADEYGFRLRVAENIFAQIARAHGGPVEVDGVRKIFVRREWVESSIGQRS